jgi:hypothetical protein
MTTSHNTTISGYPASVSAVADNDHRLRIERARLAGLAFAAVLLAASMWSGAIAPKAALVAGGAAALAAVALIFHSAQLAAARDEATDRLIELDAFAPTNTDSRVTATVQRRRRCLVGARNRLALAAAVRRDARRTRGLVAPPPAARLLTECPVLAARIAEELECDQADERLVIEVSRMLSAGAPEWDRLDRI